MDPNTPNSTQPQSAQPAQAGYAEPPLQIFEESNEDLRAALSQFERQHILNSLRRHRYDKIETARSLHIGLSSLYRKLEELNIPKNLSQVDAQPQQAQGG